MLNPFRSHGWTVAEEWREAFHEEQREHASTRRELVSLSMKLTELQRAGFSLAPPEPPGPPPITPMDPEIKAALDARFPPNSTHRGMVLRQIDEWVTAGREPEWIARRLWDGE